MPNDRIHAVITSLRSEIDGELVSVNRLVDGLLDIRLAAEGQPAIIGLVDASLTSIPGRTVAPNAWWEAQLDQLELADALTEDALAVPAG